MSNQSFSNAWLSSGDGPGSPVRPGFGRYQARNSLVKHHNLRGEAVFLASRRWHHAKAHTQAAKMRLDRALREADDAEMAELSALMSMGIGRRSMASFNRSRTDRPHSVTPARPGGYREKLEKRIAAEAATDGPVRKHNLGSRARSAPPGRPGADTTPAKSGSSNARAAWAAKMQSAGASSGASPASPTGSLETKKPRNRAKAATTRD